jgi:putative addiction module antidote
LANEGDRSARALSRSTFVDDLNPHSYIYSYGGFILFALKLRRVGTSTGTVLPKEMLARLRVGPGETVYATEAPDGSFRLTPYNPDFERQMELAEDIMREDRDILRALAK